jgi:opacity protein-like surface antigen
MRVLLVACLLIAGAAPSLAADAQLPADWGVVSAGAAFTLHAPPGTHFEPRSGIDSFVGEFVHPDFKIQFDYGMYSNDLADMRSDGRYQQQQATVDGRAAVIVWGRGAANMSWGCAGHLVAM